MRSESTYLSRYYLSSSHCGNKRNNRSHFRSEGTSYAKKGKIPANRPISSGWISWLESQTGVSFSSSAKISQATLKVPIELGKSEVWIMNKKEIKPYLEVLLSWQYRQLKKTCWFYNVVIKVSPSFSKSCRSQSVLFNFMDVVLFIVPFQCVLVLPLFFEGWAISSLSQFCDCHTVCH